MPDRIRVVAEPPLPAVKVLLPLPSDKSRLVKDVFARVFELVGTRRIRFEIDGFEVLQDSPCSVLDPVNDLVKVFAATSSSAVTVTSSSSDSSSSEDDDEAPEQQSTKQPSTLKRKRSLSPSSSSSSSSSATTSSSASSSSSSSSSDSGSERAPAKSEKTSVPPRQGLKRTQARNKRRKLYNLYNGPKATQTSATDTASTSQQGRPASQATNEQGKERAQSPRYEPGEPPVYVPSLPSSPDLLDNPTLSATTNGTSNEKTQTPPANQETKKKRRRSGGNGNRVVPPSERSDLPPNLVVTAVDVELEGWEPGQVELITDTSIDWKGWSQQVVPKQNGQVNGERKEHRGKMTLETVSKSFQMLKKVGANDARVGQVVAVQTLDLDSETFTPALVTRFGKIKTIEPLTVELDEVCRPVKPADDEYVEEESYYYGDDDEQWAGESARFEKPRFGMPIDDESNDVHQDESVWTGEWSQADVRLL